VTNTNDAGAGSLRAAIDAVNADPAPGQDTISFNIGDGNEQTIKLLSPLPQITHAVSINAETQPLYTFLLDMGTPRPVIILDGSQAVVPAGTIAYGLDINAGDSIIQGLSIINFNEADLLAAGIHLTQAGSNGILADYIGVDPEGNTHGNNIGISIGTGSDKNTIGSADWGQRNVIAGNSTDGILLDGDTTLNQIIGNYIGTNPAGTGPLSNGKNGIEIGSSTKNTIGGSAAGMGNTISGNGSCGINVSGLASTHNANQILGNYIGTDANGNVAVPNNDAGVGIDGDNWLIMNNVISGNGADGISAIGNRTLVFNNVIGTNAAKTKTIANGTGVKGGNGVTIVGDENEIGGPTTGNTIAGNVGWGIYIDGNDNVIHSSIMHAGNTIGNQKGDIKAVGVGNAVAGNELAWSGGPGISIVAGTGNRLSQNRIVGNAGVGIDLGATA
jgi:hypothetical protein